MFEFCELPASFPKKRAKPQTQINNLNGFFLIPKKMNNGKSKFAKRKRFARKNYRRRKPRYFKKFKKTSYDGAVYVKVFNLDPVYYKTTYEGYFVTGWG